jgi:hypothetical protein
MIMVKAVVGLPERVEPAELNVKVDLQRIKSNMEMKLRNEAESAVNDVSRIFFQRPGYYNTPPGIGYAHVKNLFEETFLSDESQKLIQSIIDAKWDAALTLATEEAIAREAAKAATKALKAAKKIAQYKSV